METGKPPERQEQKLGEAIAGVRLSTAVAVFGLVIVAIGSFGPWVTVRLERVAQRTAARLRDRAANDDATRIRLASTSESAAATGEPESLPGVARQLDGQAADDDSGTSASSRVQ
jgi:hypothetical protein